MEAQEEEHEQVEQPMTGKEIEYVCDHRVVKDGNREDVEFRVKFKPAWVRYKQFKQDDDKQLLKQYLHHEEYPGDRCVLIHLLLEAELEAEGIARGLHPTNAPEMSVPEDSETQTRENWAKEFITEKVVSLSNEVHVYADRVADLEQKLIMRNNRANHFKKIATDNEKECQKLRKALEEEKMLKLDAEGRMEELEDQVRRQHARYSTLKDNFEALQKNLTGKVPEPRWRTVADAHANLARKRKAEDTEEEDGDDEEEDDQQDSHPPEHEEVDEEPVKKKSRRERQEEVIRRSSEQLKKLGLIDDDFEAQCSKEPIEDFCDSDDGIREDLIDDYDGHQGIGILQHVLSKRPRLSPKKQEPDLTPAQIRKLQAALPNFKRK